MRSLMAQQLSDFGLRSSEDKAAETHRLLKETRVRSKKRRRRAREKLLEKYGMDPEGRKKDE